MGESPSLSTDQLAALVELARQGTLRAAAEALHLSEQGVRNRLIALESRLPHPTRWRRSWTTATGSPWTGA